MISYKAKYVTGLVDDAYALHIINSNISNIVYYTGFLSVSNSE